MKKIKRKSILVIGGTGFIGYHLLKKAIQLKWKATSLSRTKVSRNRKIKKVKYLKLDINTTKIVTKKLNDKYDFIINLSGQLKNTSKLVSCLSNLNVKKFLHIGSSAEYGNIKSSHSENAICKPISNYGRTNLKFTKNLLKIYKNTRFPIIILRLFQVYGSGDNLNKIIPMVIKTCSNNKKVFLTKGLQTRDFCYIEDAINAIILTLNTKNKKVIGEIFNVGTGISITIRELACIIQKKIGAGKLIFGSKKMKKSEILHSKASIKKIKQYINWSPKVTIEQGLNKLINNG